MNHVPCTERRPEIIEANKCQNCKVFGSMFSKDKQQGKRVLSGQS